MYFLKNIVLKIGVTFVGVGMVVIWMSRYSFLFINCVILKMVGSALRECSGSFEDVSSNTVICFWGIPKEFRRKMTVLLDISDKDPLHSHCYHVNDCQKSNFVTKRRSAFFVLKKNAILLLLANIFVSKRRFAFLYWKKMPPSFY